MCGDGLCLTVFRPAIGYYGAHVQFGVAFAGAATTVREYCVESGVWCWYDLTADGRLWLKGGSEHTVDDFSIHILELLGMVMAWVVIMLRRERPLVRDDCILCVVITLQRLRG